MVPGRSRVPPCPLRRQRARILACDWVPTAKKEEQGKKSQALLPKRQWSSICASSFLGEGKITNPRVPCTPCNTHPSDGIWNFRFAICHRFDLVLGSLGSEWKNNGISQTFFCLFGVSWSLTVEWRAGMDGPGHLWETGNVPAQAVCV